TRVRAVFMDGLVPGFSVAASPAGSALARVRIPEHAVASLPSRKAPAWAFLHGLKSPLSSTALRALRRQSENPHRLHRKAKSTHKFNSSKTSNKKRGTKSTKSKLAARTGKRRGRKQRKR